MIKSWMNHWTESIDPEQVQPSTSVSFWQERIRKRKCAELLMLHLTSAIIKRWQTCYTVCARWLPIGSALLRIKVEGVDHLFSMNVSDKPSALNSAEGFFLDYSQWLVSDSQQAGLGWKLLRCSASHSHCHAAVSVTRYHDACPAARGSPASAWVRPVATRCHRTLIEEWARTEGKIKEKNRSKKLVSTGLKRILNISLMTNNLMALIYYIE